MRLRRKNCAQRTSLEGVARIRVALLAYLPAAAPRAWGRSFPETATDPGWDESRVSQTTLRRMVDVGLLRLQLRFVNGLSAPICLGLSPIARALRRRADPGSSHIRSLFSTVIFVSRAGARIERGFTAIASGAEKNGLPVGRRKRVEMLCFQGPS